MFKEGGVYHFRSDSHAALFATMDKTLAKRLEGERFEVTNLDEYGNVETLTILGESGDVEFLSYGVGDFQMHRCLISCTQFGYFFEEEIVEKPVGKVVEDWYTVMVGSACVDIVSDYGNAKRSAYTHKMANPKETVEIYKRVAVAEVGVSFKE